MQNNYATSRLSLDTLTTGDLSFIRQLVNTPGWIRFIGDRKVHSDADAMAYIQKILDNTNVTYWVVKLKDGQTPIGVVTFIKRDYLEHHDIGFAFLPGFSKSGYAFEAATIVLHDAMAHSGHLNVLATTIPENKDSIRLLQKLGLSFCKEIRQDNETLLVYSINSREQPGA